MIPNGSITVPSRRVLLVENSPGDRQLLRNWLNAEMIETYEAVDIITTLAACQKYLPNLILLQLRLHTWDGYEVIRRLKDDPRTRSVPVIFVAASALTAEKAKGIDMGAVDFVSKPFDSVELLARVNSALRTKALLDLLESRAHLDGLTELGNRFALQDALPLEFEACRQSGQPISVVMIDLDHFKKVNDSYGHAAGDEVLRRTAMILRGSVRPMDFLARYGGEEFVVLSPNCDHGTALETAERIRQGIADLKVTFRNSLIQTTSSLGVATVPLPLAGEPTEVLEKADQALYRAKSSGRNAVWYWDIQQKQPAAAFAIGDGRPASEPASSRPPSRHSPKPRPSPIPAPRAHPPISESNPIEAAAALVAAPSNARTSAPEHRLTDRLAQVRRVAEPLRVPVATTDSQAAPAGEKPIAPPRPPLPANRDVEGRTPIAHSPPRRFFGFGASSAPGVAGRLDGPPPPPPPPPPAGTTSRRETESSSPA